MANEQRKPRARRFMRPQGVGEGMVTIKGGDVLEAFILARDPAARSKDQLLLRAKLLVGYAKANHLSDTELWSVSWFAHLPNVAGDIHEAVFDETNFLASAFWGAWKRDPEAVLRLTKLIRNRLKNARVESQLSKYSETKAARWKRIQRERRVLKPSSNVQKFAYSWRGIR